MKVCSLKDEGMFTESEKAEGMLHLSLKDATTTGEHTDG
jgi:hypothetical protein